MHATWWADRIPQNKLLGRYGRPFYPMSPGCLFHCSTQQFSGALVRATPFDVQNQSEFSQQDRSAPGTLHAALDDNLLTDTCHGENQHVTRPGELPDEFRLRHAIQQQRCMFDRVHTPAPSPLRNKAQTISGSRHDLLGYIDTETVIVPCTDFIVSPGRCGSIPFRRRRETAYRIQQCAESPDGLRSQSQPIAPRLQV